MVIKNILKLVLLLIIGNLILGLSGMFFAVSLIPFFTVFFTIIVIILFFKFAKFLIKGAILLLIISLVVMNINFTTCSSVDGEITTKCNCLGFEKRTNKEVLETVEDFEISQCVGYVKNYSCYNTTLELGQQEMDCSTF